MNFIDLNGRIWITTSCPADSVVSAKGDQYLLFVIQAIKATLKNDNNTKNEREIVCSALFVSPLTALGAINLNRADA